MSIVRVMTTFLLVVALVGAGAGCARKNAFAGNVLDDIVTVSVPPTAQLATVVSVPARVGATVSAGDPLIQLDPAVLAAGVVSATAARDTLKAQRRVLADADAKITDGRGTISSTRTKLRRVIAALAEQRSTLVAQRAQLQALLDSLPPTPPPGFPTPAELRAALNKIDVGLAKIDLGLAKARAGLAKLARADAKLADARAQVRTGRRLVDVGVAMADVGIQVAEWRLASATITAPESGTVVRIARTGGVLAAGATLVTLRTARPSRVIIWVTPAQANDLSRRLLSSAYRMRFSVSGDWSGTKSYPAAVTRIGKSAEYPPTSLATREIHMTRAVRVELTVETRDTLPPGAPVDAEMIVY